VEQHVHYGDGEEEEEEEEEVDDGGWGGGKRWRNDAVSSRLVGH